MQRQTSLSHAAFGPPTTNGTRIPLILLDRTFLLLADTSSAAAYQAYLTYTASGQSSSDFTTFQTAQTACKNALTTGSNNLQADLNTALGYSSSRTSSSSLAQQIITEQTAVALPLPGVSTLPSSSHIACALTTFLSAMLA